MFSLGYHKTRVPQYSEAILSFYQVAAISPGRPLLGYLHIKTDIYANGLNWNGTLFQF